MPSPVYLDNNATTPLDPQVLAVMQTFFVEEFGNPMSSQHAFGWRAKEAVEKARVQCARLIHAEPREITFTSGATESIHLAILGLLEALSENKKDVLHILTSPVEHKCVLEVCARAAKRGHQVDYLPVNAFGQVEITSVANMIQENTVLISVMHANNEIGSLNHLIELAQICKQHNVLLHVDAAQTLGKIPIDVRQGIDLLSASGHKIYGPKGIGFLYTRLSSPRVRLEPYLVGGGQEKGMRGGTHNVPGIVGFGKACELAGQSMTDEALRLTGLRDQMIAGICNLCEEMKIPFRLNGHPNERLPTNVSCNLGELDADDFVLAMTDVAYSSASACLGGTGGSHVLRALGYAEDPHSITLRFGLGRFTKESEILFALVKLREAILKSKRKSMG